MKTKRPVRFSLALVFVVFLLWSALKAGDNLVLTSEPQPSDAVLLYLGDAYRTETAARFLKEGFTSKIIFFSVFDDSLKTTPTQAILHGYGIAESSLIKINRVVKNTAEESREFVNHIASIPGIKRVTVVSSPYHMLRIRYLLEYFRKKQKADIEFFYLPATDKRFNPKRWWANSFSRNIVVKEYVKLIYFVAVDKYRY